MFKMNIKKCISSLLAVVTLATSLSVGCVAFAEDLVSINETNFADKNFRTIISEVYDVNENGFLEASERSKKVITLSGYLLDCCGEDAKITTLKGIEYFTELEKLYCASVGLTELDLSRNTKLTQVTCMGNDLQAITIGSLPNLTRLDCSANEITAIDVSGCPALQELQCYANEIASLNVKSNPALTLLYAEQNQLTKLDVTTNTNLNTLYCSHNHLTELDLGRNSRLGETTTEMIGDQWVNANSFINNNKIQINFMFSDKSKLISSSLDNRVETEDGVITNTAYNGTAFVTSELSGMANRIYDPVDGQHKDGFFYRYNVNNANCDNMTVNVLVSRSFYQVNFYLDETKSVRLSYQLVSGGYSATAPDVPAAPTCKKYVAWSDTCTNITEDKDIYIKWADDHNIVKSMGTVIDIRCSKCDKVSIHFNFADAYNKKVGEDGYEKIGDVNNDGIINAKDYAILVRM